MLSAEIRNETRKDMPLYFSQRENLILVRRLQYQTRIVYISMDELLKNGEKRRKLSGNYKT